MPQDWKELGQALKRLRINWDLAQKEVIDRLGETIGDRTLRAYESGTQRPSRNRLLKLLIRSFDLRDAGQLNRYLGFAGYGLLSESEIHKLELETETEAQRGCERYIHPAGYFQKEGKVWNEYRRSQPKPVFTFTELRRDADYIYLFDDSRSKDPGRPMYLRIPLCGGIAQWTYPNPVQWEDVLVVEPARG
jgi:transcriptional regulator with XRE-family HTH domain